MTTDFLQDEALMTKARLIELLILDVDGVLTDGRLFFDNDGVEYKSFNSRDGLGLRLVWQSGIELAVISGRKSKSVATRMKMLGIEHVYQGYKDKRLAFKELLRATGIDPAHIAYVGDDLIDLPVMTQVGLAIAVNDANFAVKNHAHWCTTLAGGQGAVREVCDMLMLAQGTYEEILNSYL
jgi:3-deoxy-D-manno-octulosonate 8-phosphate phosphatase (KDO 8-P phosphatase)